MCSEFSMITRAATAVMTLLLNLSPSQITAQTVINIKDLDSCGKCQLTLTETLRLGKADDPSSVSTLADVTIDSQGRFAVGSQSNPGEVLIYSPSGRFLKVVGRRGGGPGEFQGSVQPRFGPGDSLFALDIGTNRISVFDPELKYLRAITLPGRISSFTVGPGAQLTVVSPVRGTADLNLVQIVSSQGEAIASFEAADPSESRGYGAGMRHLSVSADGRIWVMPFTDYSIRSYDSKGKPAAGYRASREWLNTEGSTPTALRPGQPPPVSISTMRVDRNGLVWVFAAVPDSDWERVLASGSQPKANQMYDTIVEVFHPNDGRLIAWFRSRDLVFPLDDHRLYSIVELDSGIEVVQLWDVKLPAR